VFLDKNGVAERRAVSLGLEIGADVEVTAGLEPGDKVVVSGPAGLRDGQRIKVR
jgi:multidrug efflux pump subunit AcrA (membrane-fusion protein)